VRIRLTLSVVAAVAAVTGLTAWLLGWSVEHALILSPVVVMVAGAIAFLVVLWTRIAWESIRGRRRS
jgi:uncharacterized membrane protein